MQKQYYKTLNAFLREKHGEKVIKLSVDAGFTCPNRDGKISQKGCLFCSDKGSGDFTHSAPTITSQLSKQTILLSKKWPDTKKYIAYFQAFTNTYAALDVLKAKYEEALAFPGVVGIAIATRPDCLSDEVIAYLGELSTRTHLWVELGLQTIHDRTSDIINRGYTLDVFDTAVKKLAILGIEVVSHLIIGLPHETTEDIVASVKYISNLPLQGIKLHMLHVLDNSPLGDYYNKNPFPIMTEVEYINLLGMLIPIIPKNFVIHRLTGDGPKEHLIAPCWTKNKRHVLNGIYKYFAENDIYQGKYLN